jgi:NHLM bacteriocin system ABC transporter ATP-binding protein
MPEAAHVSGADLLLVTASAVARATGLELVSAPADSSASNHDRLHAIARASRVRMRQVALTGQWWTRDAGPLIGFVRDTNGPVALLPSGSSYDVVDSATQPATRTRVGLAHPLAPAAYMFYRPLPDRLNGPIQMLRFALRGHGGDLRVALMTATAATLLGMLTPLATAAIINTAIPDGDRALVFQITLGLAAAVFGRVVVELCQGIALLRVETRSSADVQAALWDRLLNLGPRFFRTYTVGDLHARASAVSEVRSRLSAVTIRALFLGLLGALNLSLMFYYSARLAIVAVAATSVFVAATATCGAAAYRYIAELQALRGRVVGLTVQLINGVARLRVAAAERLAFASWAARYHDQQVLTIRVQRLGDTITVLNDVLPALASTLLFWFAAQGLQSGSAAGSLTTGVFLAFIAAFNIFLGGASALSMSAIELLSVTSIWSRAKPILDAPIEADAHKTDPGVLQGGLALENVTFRYTNDGPAILDGVSIRVEPDSFVALVGPTGSGKSTVFRLLLGFERPESGAIRYDGKDLAALDVRAVRRQLGIVLQNSNIMAGSIFENIGAGGAITLAHAWAAARAAALDRDIEGMPMGLYTFISEGGTNLSVGQRQRLLIARALASSPRVLLFDEATSALDNVTQAIVQQSLERISVTRIVIAHRLSTIRRADRIYVLQHGRIVQEGTFDELAAQDGLFVRLMAGQML